METLLEILKYSIPGLIVLLASYIILKSFLENETIKQLNQLKQSNSKTLIPLKQLYISDDAWQKIKEAKDEMIHLINTCGGDLDDKAMGTALAADVLQIAANKRTLQINEAILMLKNEFNELF